MGLLEKALHYKQQMNKEGKETLIDRITGPAETEFIDDRIDVKKEIKAETQDTDSQPFMERGEGPDTIRQERIDIELTDDDLFKLPDDEQNKKENSSEFQNYDAVIIDDNAKMIAADEESEYLNAEDEPDLHALQHDSIINEDTAIDDKPVNRYDSNTKFKIIQTEDDKFEGNNASNHREANKHEMPAETVSMKPDKKFQDFVVLCEIGKEIIKSQTLHQLYDCILFSVMGQIGSSSATLLVASSDEENVMKVADSRGITIKNKNIRFDMSKGLFRDIVQTKGVVDVEKYKHDPHYRDEYYQLIAIDARLVVPLRYDTALCGALVLGDKITIGDYNSVEMDFLEQISEFAAIAYEKINKIENFDEVHKQYNEDKNFWNTIDDYKQRLRTYPQVDYFIATAQSLMKANGMISYAFYAKNEKQQNYSLVFTDDNDILLLRDAAPFIRSESGFINYITALNKSSEVEDFDRNKIIKDTFTESGVRKMTVQWISSLKTAEELLGFMCVFRLSDYQLKDMQFERFRIISDTLLTYYWSFQGMEAQHAKYVDVIMPVYNRINKELLNAEKLSIPLTVVLFTIKNMKRYYAVQGKDKTRELMQKIENIMASRLSEADFISKIDRNKFLIALPGKNKKYAVPFANALKNEMVQQFSEKELQLLVTFLMAEYPDDGADLFTLLDAVD